MEQTNQWIIQNLVQIISIGAMLGVFYGSIRAEIKELQKKQDKHNNIVERMYRTEESLNSCHLRVTELAEDLRDHLRRWNNK